MEETPIANISETLSKLRAEELAHEEIGAQLTATGGDKLVKCVHLYTGHRGFDGMIMRLCVCVCMCVYMYVCMYVRAVCVCCMCNRLNLVVHVGLHVCEIPGGD